MFKRAFPVLLLPALAACASTPGEYPSLALRDAERVTGTMEAPEPYVPTQPTSETLTSVEALVEQANGAYESYRGKLEAARKVALAARGAEVGSDAWAAASIAIAGLETERSRTMVPLAEIDRLTVAAATEGGATQELEAAQQLVGQMVDFETAKIDEIWNALR